MTHLRWSGKTLWDFYFIKSDLWEWWRSNRNGSSSPLPLHPFSFLLHPDIPNFSAGTQIFNMRHWTAQWRHENISFGSWRDVIGKDGRAAQSSTLVWLQSAHPARWKGKLLLWSTSFGVQKHPSCHCVILPSPKETVLFLGVKVSVTLVFSLNLFTDIGVRIECTVLKSQYWLSQQLKLLLFLFCFLLLLCRFQETLLCLGLQVVPEKEQ